ncbi:hypothetical protein PV325_007179 [Microctonus aethiopoides]|nr:hypothetical protein PV325_007179 [Microctonus aethiopoides]
MSSHIPSSRIIPVHCLHPLRRLRIQTNRHLRFRQVYKFKYHKPIVLTVAIAPATQNVHAIEAPSNVQINR